LIQTVNITQDGYDDKTGQEVYADGIVIYPNPVTSTMFINSSGKTVRKVEVYSLFGLLTISRTDVTDRFDVSGLPGGVYVVKVYTDKEIIVTKIVKK
jgi:hypothetical protein